jgi:hypothetical protein
MKDETRLMVDNKLASIQLAINVAGDKLFGQNADLGMSLKRCAFELGMVRAVLSKSRHAIDAHPTVDEEVQE